MQRDLRIDLLRFLGLSLIFLAHVQAPYTLIQVRTFDVPMMLFISGLTMAGKEIDNIGFYLWRRTKRLIIPVWLFLAVYLTSFYFFQFKILPKQYLTFEMIYRSFLLLDRSIGYVWIIRVFLLVMFITPLLLKILKKNQSNSFFCVLIGIFLFVDYILIVFVNCLPDSFAKEFIDSTLVYLFAYSVPFLIGCKMKDLSTLNPITIFLMLLFSLLMIHNIMIHKNPFAFSELYKSPPHPYYIVYGSLVASSLWVANRYWVDLCKLKLPIFIGQNTIWLYLWHMPFALFATVFMHVWYIKYLFVYSAALFVFSIQYTVVKKINLKFFSTYFLG